VLKVFGLAFLRSLWQMCASKPFQSAARRTRTRTRTRSLKRTDLRPTFVGHFVQSLRTPQTWETHPIHPHPRLSSETLCQVVKNISISVGPSCRGRCRAWILHMFICLYDWGLEPAQIGTQLKRLQIRNSFRLFFAVLWMFVNCSRKIQSATLTEISHLHL